MSDVHASGAAKSDPEAAGPAGADHHAHSHDSQGPAGHVPPPPSGAASLLVGLLVVAGVLAAIGGFLSR